MSPVEVVLSKLHGVTRTATGWTARCPAHEDDRASLAVSEGEDARALMHCHAGCSTEAAVAAMSLGMKDLFPPERNGFRPNARIVTTYDYTDEHGALLYEVVRFEPKDFRQRRPDGRDGWTWKLDGVRRVLFHLPQLLGADPATPVYLVEGEKDVLALEKRGLMATTNCGGAGKWRAEYSEALRSRHVILLPDNDNPGRKHAADVADALVGVAASVRVITLPGLPPKGDVSDWLEQGRGVDELRVLIAVAPPWADIEHNAESTTEGSRATVRQAAALVPLASAWELWHTPEGVAYATLPVGEHHETYRLRSRAIRVALGRAAYLSTGRPARGEAMSEALDVLEGRALYEGETHPVAVRLAEHAGSVYLDLGDPAWRVVEMGPLGSRVIAQSPVRFLRPRGLAPLPTPTPGGSLDELRAVLGRVNDDEWSLLVAWLLAALRPRGPYPVLGLHGEQGSAKSTTARILRGLLDPSTVPLRAEPRTVQDLLIAATSGWVVALDNVSRLQPWLSDALCRLATGGGYSTRELYTNGEEYLLDAQRPVVLTGIEELTTRGDLADRTIIVTLPSIADEERRTETELWALVETMRPRVLGALLTAVAHGLRHQDAVRLPRLPRMADAAVWVAACVPALGLDPEAVLQAWHAQRDAAAATSLEASAVGEAVIAHMKEREKWEGTATALLGELASQVPDEVRRDRYRWPATPRGLSGALRRLAPALRTFGVEVETGARETTRNRGRVLVLRHIRPERPDRPKTGNGAVPRGRLPDGCADGSAQPSNPGAPSDAGLDDADGSDGIAANSAEGWL